MGMATISIVIGIVDIELVHIFVLGSAAAPASLVFVLLFDVVWGCWLLKRRHGVF